MPATIQTSSTLSTAEERLVGEVLGAIADRDSQGDAALARPLRIVVPSQSLRDHVSRALVRRAGRSLLALRVETHHTAALEVLSQARSTTRSGDRLVPLWATRLAAQEPVLNVSLGGYRDGLATVYGTVRDLLDAGFRPHHLAPALEVLEANQEVDPFTLRSGAILRVAAALSGVLETRALTDPSLFFEEAVRALETGGPGLWPCAGLWIYGYADATGMTSDWLAALAKVHEGRVIVETPAVEGAPLPFAVRFVDALLTRGLTHDAERRSEAPRALSTECVDAADHPAEIRWVAAEIAELLRKGCPPEDIGVCGRNLSPYIGLVEQVFDEAEIPFSAPGLRVAAAAPARAASALGALLVQAGSISIDRFLLLAAPGDIDLRTALHHLGLPRLDLLAGESGDVPWSRDGTALPVRRDHSRARRVSGAALDALRARARAVLHALESWPAVALASQYGEALRILCRERLAWCDRGEFRELLRAIDAFVAALPEIHLTRDEWNTLLMDALEDALAVPFAGAGAGVQLLSVMEARGRRFHRLFVVGMNREQFPRPIAEDPLFSDGLRRRLQVILPDLAEKSRGHDEERHLFASLLGAAERVTLSRPQRSEAGRELAESPLRLRFRLEHPEAAAVTQADTGMARERTSLRSAARVTALAGGRQGLDPFLPALLRQRRAIVDEILERESHRGNDAVDAIVGTVRAALRELDPAPGDPQARQLGPFFGRTGRGSGDTASDLWITGLGSFLRCPWQHFLQKTLRLRPAPDASGELPALDARTLGQALHLVLERVVASRGGAYQDSLEAALAGGATSLCWPDGAALRELVAAVCHEVATPARIALPLYPELLAQRLAGLVARARERDKRDASAVYGAELVGHLAVCDLRGETRRIAFRADRVEAHPSGAIAFVEYKSGRCFLDRVSAEKRVARLGQGLWRGEGIQVPAALFAEGIDPDRGVVSRISFLGDVKRESMRDTEISHRDGALEESFADVARHVFALLDAGLRVPRLLSEKGQGEGEACRACEVRAACLQGETAQSARLQRVLGPARADAVGAEALLPALFLGKSGP